MRRKSITRRLLDWIRCRSEAKYRSEVEWRDFEKGVQQGLHVRVQL